MAQINRILWLATTLALSATALGQCPQSTAGPSATSLTIIASKDTVVAGTPVLVKATLTNKSNQNIPIWLENTTDQGGYLYDVELRNAEGGSPIKTKFAFYHDSRVSVQKMDINDLDSRYLRFSGSCFTLKAGASILHDLDVTKMYALDEPGTYTIDLIFSGSGVISNPVSVTIVPVPPTPSSDATQQVSSSEPLSLEIKATNDIIKSGGLVDVLVSTNNVSARRIVLRRQEQAQDTGMLGSVFRVDVLDSLSSPPPETEFGQSKSNRADTPPDPASMVAARAAGTLVSLKPGQDWRNTIRVSELYDLSKPGQYTIQVRRWDDETKTWVKSNPLTVTVTP